MRDQVSRTLVRVITFVLLWLLLGCNQVEPDNSYIPAIVERVVSGQTLEVIIDGDSHTERVRIELSGLILHHQISGKHQPNKD